MTTVENAKLTGVSANRDAADQPLDRSPAGKTRRLNRAFRVSWFDCVTSSLMALILFIGTFVVMLVVAWLIDSDPPTPYDQPHPIRRVSAQNPVGLERDFLKPGEVEVEQLLDASAESLLSAVIESASLVAGSPVMSSLEHASELDGENGWGDFRVPVSPTDAIDGIPEYQRWQLNFSAKNLGSYARQLDDFGIELGVIGGAVQGVDYVSELSSSLTTRRADSESERRLYFMWNEPGPLMHFDRELLGRAGVELANREMLKFIPPELKNRLTQIELEYARSVGRDSLSEIAKTIFESYPAGDGYQFKVIHQRYRRLRN